MAELIRRRWQGQGVTGLPRRDRQSCYYDAYVPDKLVGRPILLDGDVAADVAEAETAVARLNAEGLALTSTEVLARLLLRAESVASSKIEGLEIGGRRLLRADLARDLRDQSRDTTADEVLRNVDAMVWALRSSSHGEAITSESLLEINRRLLKGTHLESHAGRIRTEQNWIGGSNYNPCSAAYVPPPPEHVPELLADLCSFCNEDLLPAVAQAALAHAQFETIHPFVDGNGRTGRALVHLILRRRGLAPRVLPPISLILATWARDYVEGLTATRYVGAWDSAEAHTGTNRWIALFGTACRRAVEDASDFEARIRELQSEWRTRLGSIRRDSALDHLVQLLPGAPVITTSSAAELTKRSFQATNDAIQRLVDTGILGQITVGRRNRAFEAREIVDAFAQLERQLASPEGDTRTSEPVRAIPPRIRRG